MRPRDRLFKRIPTPEQYETLPRLRQLWWWCVVSVLNAYMGILLKLKGIDEKKLYPK